MFKLFCVKQSRLYSFGHLQQFDQNTLIIPSSLPGFDRRPNNVGPVEHKAAL